MTIIELIEKHTDYDGGRRALRKFAIELLELVQNEAEELDSPDLTSRTVPYGQSIDKALAALKEKP